MSLDVRVLILGLVLLPRAAQVFPRTWMSLEVQACTDTEDDSEEGCLDPTDESDSEIDAVGAPSHSSIPAESKQILDFAQSKEL